VNTAADRSPARWLPLVGGALLVLQFAGLCAWQVGRGLEKLEARAAFDGPVSYSSYHPGLEVRSYQPLEATGRYDGGHQFLLDNIILDNRYGYYVITPLMPDAGGPALLVNRGWVEKSGLQPDLIALARDLELPDGRVMVRGRTGSLPRAGMRMGDPVTPSTEWPKTAVFPQIRDLSRALGSDALPFVLLLDPQDEHGFVRHWVPEEMGPGRHFAYAFQWAAMAAVLAGLLWWHYRRRGAGRE
jgi:surfeit locus 1 family protein